MIHSKISSPCVSQRKKRRTSSGKSLIGSAKSKSDDFLAIRYSDLYKRENFQSEIVENSKEKRKYLIAPDGLIPNSSLRSLSKKKEIKPIEIKKFQLRWDIIQHLPKINNDLDDDEDYIELDDPDTISKSKRLQKSKGTWISQEKDIKSDLFKRLQNEPWWTKTKEENANLHSILLHLYEILKLRHVNSYESACFYIFEIYRTSKLDKNNLNQIILILLENCRKERNDRLDLCTIRTVAQFNIERKDIVVCLLEFALKCQSKDLLQQVINSIKFITDVNNSDDIDLILKNMVIVYNCPSENFSLKNLINILKNKMKNVITDDINLIDNDEIHPLLKKISQERWFPKENLPITVDYVLDAIINQLKSAKKALIKTLPAYLVQLHQVIGFLKEQVDRAANCLISLLSHDDADFRVIAATNLGNLGEETKTIDLALLHSFVNDSRILVRTECCDTLKKLSGITSDTVLKDCADDIQYLKTLSEENFSLRNYLKEKNRVATTMIDEKNEIDEISENIDTNQIEIDENLPSSSEIIERSESKQLSNSTIVEERPIHIEIIEKKVPEVTEISKPRLVRSPIREKKPLNSSGETPISDKINSKNSSILQSSTDMMDPFIKNSELNREQQVEESEIVFYPVPPTTGLNNQRIRDPIQTIIEEHKQNMGFYRMITNRRILIPHKIKMDHILSDQSHLINDPESFKSDVFQPTSMKLSDYHQNQNQLNQVESVNLISSLVIRSVQIHRQYERFTPGSFSANFNNFLTVSQAPLNSSVNLSIPFKLPPIGNDRLISKHITRFQVNTQAKASKEGINIQRAQQIEGAISNLLRPNRGQIKTRQNDVTHGWLLVELLKSKGIDESERYVRKIVQSYPKFTPLLHGKLPPSLIPVIWNDPMMKQIASILSLKQIDNSSIKQNEKKSSISSNDDIHVSNDFEYSTVINRDDHKKKFLPSIRGSKINFPHHVLKFGFREIEKEMPESQISLPYEEVQQKSRKRRVYMHLMMPANGNLSDRHDSFKSSLPEIMKSESPILTFMPIVTRPPMCH